VTVSLVTGAAGFVGGHLVRRLAERGDAVRATDVRATSGNRSPARADLPVEIQSADITDRAAARALVQGVDVVFHTASLVQTARAGAERVWAVNLGGTEALLDAAREAGVRRFVHVSSASVVYQGKDLPGGDESLPYTTASQAPYADSKIAAEKAVLAADDPAAMRTTAIRPHVVFGPGDGRFFPAILARAEAGRLRVGVGRGTKLSDFTYIDNLIDALILADEALARDPGLGGRAYFVTNGEPMGFWDFIDRVLVEIGQPRTKGRVPYAVAYAAAALVEWGRALAGRQGAPEDGFTRFAVRYMCTHHYFHIDRARRDLGYEPKVSIDEGIRRTIAARRAERAR
jgi:nucleoside-diphosphate-sugar epimerase